MSVLLDIIFNGAVDRAYKHAFMMSSLVFHEKDRVLQPDLLSAFPT